MKEVSLYVCEICGTQFKDKQKCKECESGHVKPLKITGTKYVPLSDNQKGYPTMIHVRMEDGETIAYKK